jgi:DNA-binding MarR family transcriptional regulator
MSKFGESLVKNKLSNKTSASSNLDLKLRITEYLKVHGCVEESELAEALHLYIIDVLSILFEMEAKGVVKRIPDESSPDSNGG